MGWGMNGGRSEGGGLELLCVRALPAPFPPAEARQTLAHSLLPLPSPPQHLSADSTGAGGRGQV